MNHPPIKELVKDPNWQRVRNSLIGKWTTDPNWCLNQLRSFLGNIKSTSDSKLLIVINYMTGTGFRTGRISSKKNPGIGKLRGIISAEIKRRKYQGIFEQVDTVEKRRQFEIFKRLSLKYPHAYTSLKFKNPFELLVVTILSAMSTDKKANEVATIIFSKYDIHDLANIGIQELEKIVYPCAVDTHTFRVARRLELSMSDIVPKVEQDLMKQFPQDDWGKVHWQLQLLGKNICTSRNPKHRDCPLYDICPNNNI